MEEQPKEYLRDPLRAETEEPRIIKDPIQDFTLEQQELNEKFQWYKFYKLLLAEEPKTRTEWAKYLFPDEPPSKSSLKIHGYEESIRRNGVVIGRDSETGHLHLHEAPNGFHQREQPTEGLDLLEQRMTSLRNLLDMKIRLDRSFAPEMVTLLDTLINNILQ